MGGQRRGGKGRGGKEGEENGGEGKEEGYFPESWGALSVTFPRRWNYIKHFDT